MKNTNIQFVPANIDLAVSYNQTVDSIARERKYLAALTGFPVESSKGFIQMIVQNNFAQYYAVVENQVIGWCDIIPKSFEGLSHVGNLGMGLLPEYRGQGIGAQLFEMTQNHAKVFNHIEKLELEVFESNIHAIKLYEKLGFVFEGRRVKARKLDGVYDNILLMGKFIE